MISPNENKDFAGSREEVRGTAFDLEKALEGAPLISRRGHPVINFRRAQEIIANGSYPFVGTIDFGKGNLMELRFNYLGLCDLGDAYDVVIAEKVSYHPVNSNPNVEDKKEEPENVIKVVKQPGEFVPPTANDLQIRVQANEQKKLMEQVFDRKYNPISPIPPNALGLRYNNDKPRHSLIDPYALNELAKVLTFGAKKYKEHNWRNGLSISETLDSLLRHVEAFNSGEDFDSESTLHHIAHAMCNCMFILWMHKYKPDMDDRFKFHSENYHGSAQSQGQ